MIECGVCVLTAIETGDNDGNNGLPGTFLLYNLQLDFEQEIFLAGLTKLYYQHGSAILPIYMPCLVTPCQNDFFFFVT